MPEVGKGKQKSVLRQVWERRQARRAAQATAVAGGNRVAGSRQPQATAGSGPIAERVPTVTAPEGKRSSDSQVPDVRREILEAIRTRHAAATEQRTRDQLKNAIDELERMIAEKPDHRPPSLPNGQPLDPELVLELYVRRTAYNILSKQPHEDFQAGLRFDFAQMHFEAVKLRIHKLGVDPEQV